MNLQNECGFFSLLSYWHLGGFSRLVIRLFLIYQAVRIFYEWLLNNNINQKSDISFIKRVQLLELKNIDLHWWSTIFLDRKMDAIHGFAREGDMANLLKCIEDGVSVNVQGESFLAICFSKLIYFEVRCACERSVVFLWMKLLINSLCWKYNHWLASQHLSILAALLNKHNTSICMLRCFIDRCYVLVNKPK